MKIWNLCISAALALTIGFGAGYYAKTVGYSNEAKRPSENVSSAQTSPTPLPTTSPSASPKATLPPDIRANAPGEAYIVPNAERNQYYMLKEYLGKIAIYKVYPSGEMTLMSIVDADTEALPESDRKLLQTGIGVTTEEEMLQLIEDYTS